jgi:Carboxypeptidase regulatory-like domain
MTLNASAGRQPLAGLLALTALFVLCLLSPAAASGQGIEGTVTAPGAAEEVEVCVVEPLPSESCTYPEPDGHYLLNGLAPGASYLVEFLPSYRSHYVIQYYKGKPSPEGAQRVPVSPNSNTSGIDADLEIGGQIEGEASDAEGGGSLSGVEVCAFNATQAPTEAQATIAGCTHTDAAGEYRLPTLPPGTYKVRFWGAGESAGYLSAYYGGTSTFSTATTIAVAAGTTTSGVDATLRIGARIEGTVSEADGEPLGQIAVCARVSGSGAPQRCSYADATGHYDLGGLASGSYSVVFAPGLGVLEAEVGSGEHGFLTQYYDDVSSLAQARPISLLAPDAALGIDASLIRVSPSPLVQPAPTALIPAADSGTSTAPASSPPLGCKRGFRRRRVKGRTRCTRVKPRKPSHKKSGGRQGHTGSRAGHGGAQKITRRLAQWATANRGVASIVPR